MKDGAPDNRRSPRSKVLLSAVLELPDGPLPVILRDLSEHGALVESSRPIPENADLVFRRNKLHVRGRVQWVRTRFAGIAFARPLKSEVVLEQIARPRAATNVVHRRPGVTRQGMSPEEQDWADEMMRGPTRSQPQK